VTTYTILYWQEIPSFVEVKDGDTTKKAQLSDKFQDLIDRAAMRRKLAGTDAYLEGFNRGEPIEKDGNVDDVLQSVTEKLESEFDKIAEAALNRQSN